MPCSWTWPCFWLRLVSFYIIVPLLLPRLLPLLLLLPQWHCVESGGWPFQRLADQLCCDVLSSVWTVRHGAAAGLRELLREQAGAAAVEAPLADASSGWASPSGEGESRGGGGCCGLRGGEGGCCV